MYRLVLDDRREMIMADGQMTYEDWLRGCVHHDGRHGYVTLPCDEVLKIADFIERLRHSQHIQDVASVGCVDRKTENCSEFPNNCETCKHNELVWYSEECDGCSQAHSNYKPQTSRENTRDSRDNHKIAKTGPQVDCPWK